MRWVILIIASAMLYFGLAFLFISPPPFTTITFVYGGGATLASFVLLTVSCWLQRRASGVATPPLKLLLVCTAREVGMALVGSLLIMILVIMMATFLPPPWGVRGT